MNENVIEFCRGAEMATVTFCQGRYISKIRKLVEQYPDECEIIHENPDGSILAHVPVKWIQITRRELNLTEEQRANIAERLKNACQKEQNEPKINSDGLEDS